MYLKNVQKNGDRERVAEGGDEEHVTIGSLKREAKIVQIILLARENWQPMQLTSAKTWHRRWAHIKYKVRDGDALRARTKQQQNNTT